MLNQLLITDLRQFGLSEYESRAYLVLTMYGVSAASFVSERTRIPSSKVYDVLNSLKIKGLVEVAQAKPKKFRAIDPKYALSGIAEKRELAAKQLKDKTLDIINKLEPPEENDLSHIWSSAGRKIFFNKGSELLKKANEYVMATTSNFSRSAYLDEAILDAAKRGVKIKILGTSKLTKDSRLRAKWYAKSGANIRTLHMRYYPVFAVSDNDELIFRVNGKKKCDFIWSRNTDLVNILKSYFEQLWRKADIMQLC